MSPQLLRLYHCLPPWAQSVAATARGWKLRRWRYSSRTDTLVLQAFERETWSPEQWREWQQRRLGQLLARAVARVPYYRDLWASRGGGPEEWRSLANWPILEKEAVRANPASFVADDCDRRRMFPEHTSGSTGTPLHLWWSRETTHDWYGLFEARWKQWYGVTRHDRWGMLGGQRVIPAARTSPPFWVWNAAMHQLYLSAYHMSLDSMGYYLDAIRDYGIRYLWGYSASLYQLAQVAIDRGITIPLQVVITNAEPLYDFQREAISRAFACPVRETYGMAEIACAASECQEGRLHLWPEAGIVELFDGGLPVAQGTPGDLVATGLFNLDMPLIRYRTGDRLALDPTPVPCACGRRLPLMTSVEGRSDDVILTLDGRRIGRLDPLFKASFPIREAQVIQHAASRIEVRYVPAAGFGSQDLRLLADRFREFLGPMEFQFTPVAEIPKTSSGKFRSVISQLPPGSLRTGGSGEGRSHT